MNPTQLKSLSDAILAHLRGEPVQWEGENGVWYDVISSPTFCSGYQWRPKPKEPRKVYMVESSIGLNPFLTTSRASADEVMNQSYPRLKVIEFVEVL